MARTSKPDPQFEIEFFEAVHRRCPDYLDVVGLLGGLYTKVGRIADGLKMDRKLVRLDPENPTAHYNLACSLALCKKRPDAIRSLRGTIGRVCALDAWLKIEKGDGKQLATNDYTGGFRDSAITWTAPADGAHAVAIGDVSHRGGGDYLYRLAIREAVPAVTATVEWPSCWLT